MKKNTKAIAAVSSLNSQNLSAEELAEAIEWREEINPKAQWAKGEAFNRKGLQTLVESAIEEYQRRALFSFGTDAEKEKKENYGYFGSYTLPWNMAGAGGPWWSLPYHQNFAIHNGVRQWVEECHPNNEYLSKFVENFERRCPDGPVEYAARFCGWLKDVAWKRGMVKVLKSSTVGGGMNSPYTTVNPFHIFERFPSPHRAERQIWAVRRRADQVLAPYGISVSWEALGQVIARGSKSVGKSAVRAAEITMRNYLSYYDHQFMYELHENRDKIFCLKAGRGLSELKTHPEHVQRWAVARVFDGEFPSIREALKNADRLVRDETDGVILYLDPETSHTVESSSDSLGSQNPPTKITKNTLLSVFCYNTFIMKFLSEIKENIKNKMKEKNIIKKDILSFIVFLLIIVVLLTTSHFFNISINSISVGLSLFFISVLTFVILIFSGKIIFKSLLHIGIELSLLLLISQSYCSVSKKLQTEQSNEAIKFLVTFALFFIVVMFLKNLYESFIKYKKNLIADNKKEDGLSYWTLISISAFMIFFFIYQLILAFTPIIKDICFLN